jgi:hypothetical protein
MSTEPDRGLGVLLRSLANVAPPPNLADAALARAERVRRRRRRATMATAAAAVVAVALATVGTRALLDRTAAPPATTTPTPTHGYVVPLYVTPVQAARANVPDLHVWLFDSEQRRYVRSPFLARYPFPADTSADGSRLLVGPRDAGDGSEFGVVSLADAAAGRTDRVRWVPWPSTLAEAQLQPPRLSPDGRTLLGPVRENELLTGFRLLEVDSGGSRVVPFDGGPYGRQNPDRPTSYTVIWGPGGRQVALHESPSGFGEGASLRLFDLDGHLQRSTRLHIGDDVWPPDQAFWSPDGRRLAFRWGSVIDLWTGEVRMAIGSAAVAGWYDNDHLVVLGWPGKGSGKELRVVDREDTRRVVRRVPFNPPEADGCWPRVVPLTGPAPPGAIAI